MEYGAYGSAPDGLPEKFGLTDTIGRKPFCEVGVFFIGQPGFHNMAAVGGEECLTASAPSGTTNPPNR